MQKGLLFESFKRIRLIANQEHYEVGQKTDLSASPPYGVLCKHSQAYEQTNGMYPERRLSIQTSDGFLTPPRSCTASSHSF